MDHVLGGEADRPAPRLMAKCSGQGCVPGLAAQPHWGLGGHLAFPEKMRKEARASHETELLFIYP